MEKLLKLLLVAGLCITNLCTFNTVQAKNQYNFDTFNMSVESYDEYEKIGFVYKAPEKFMVNGREIYTFKQFDSLEEAINLFENIYSAELEWYRQNNDLDNLSAETYKKYLDDFYETNFAGKDVFRISLRNFLSEIDTYFSNMELISAIKDAQENPSVKTYVKVDLLSRVDDVKLMDDYPELKNNIYNPKTFSTYAVSGYNVSAAIAYASKYAETVNTSYTYYRNDCTNFVSQILYAGNIPTASDGNGAWYPYSNAWINANSLMNFLGAKYGRNNSYDSLYTFSNVLNPGDVIGLDYAKNGSIDHLGFVTAKASSSGTYNGYVYYDFKVAQHTNNYHEWVTSPINKWELEFNSSKFFVAKLSK